MALDDLIQLRTGSAAWFAAANPTLAAGEPGYEVDKDRLKWGTGAAAWSALGYAERDSPIAQSLADVVTVANDTTSQIDIVVPNTAEYESLVICLVNAASATGTGYINMRFNGDTAANYDWQLINASGATVSAASSRAVSSMSVGYTSPYNAATGFPGDSFAPVIIEIPLHRMTGGFRTAISSAGNPYGSGANDLNVVRFFGMWRSAANITSIALLPSAGTFVAGTQVHCFGIKP